MLHRYQLQSAFGRKRWRMVAPRSIPKSISHPCENLKNERGTARCVSQDHSGKVKETGPRKGGLSLVALLKSCAKNKDLKGGIRIHADLRDSGLLEKDIFIGNTLISMYAKCGEVVKARQVFDELPIRDVVSWNALIAGFVEQGQGKEALSCFQQMCNDGPPPNYITYVCIMKACGIAKDAGMAKNIHDKIACQGLLEKTVVLGSALIDMYAKCGMLTKAQKVLDELPLKDVVSWSALIAGYTQQGQAQKALDCFQQMCSTGLSPSTVTYMCVLKACGIMQNAEMGKRIHQTITTQMQLEKDLLLGNALIDMYAKCGILMKAQEVLDELVIRDVFSWSALIGGYTQQGQGHIGLQCFHRMRSEGIIASAVTYVKVLKACCSMQDLNVGKKIHNEIISQEQLTKDVMLGTALVNLYVTFGSFRKAQKVLEDLPVRDAVSWTSLIAGYTQHKCGQEAVDCYQRMRSEGVSPNVITYLNILKACSISPDLEMGKEIYDEVLSQGLLENHVSLGNAVIDMYAKCGALRKAQKVFDELPVRDVVSWNGLIAGYTQQGQCQEALFCFQRMRAKDQPLDAVTYSCALKACSMAQDVDIGKQIHEEIASKGMLQKNIVLGNALIDMYAKCGVLTEAQRVFDEIPVRDVVSWSSLIAGYTQQGQGQEALECFKQMRSDGLSPDAVLYLCILKACGSAQDLDMGKKVHKEIMSEGLLNKDASIGAALVDMYIKCAAISKSQEVFDKLSTRNVVSWTTLTVGYVHHGQGQEAVCCFQKMRHAGLSPDIVSWNAIIGGFAQQGLALEALDCFQCMQEDGMPPNGITLLHVLSACSHSGLVDEGQMYFKNMKETYGILPDKEHYTCMVDLFGRARLFRKAIRVVMMMPWSDYLPVWSTLLSACQKWGNVKLGRLAFEHTVQLEGCDAGAYVLMSNIYAGAGLLEEAQKIDSMRIEKVCFGSSQTSPAGLRVC